jgi:peptidyl-tRNA hydrolase, PTH1 family
MKLIIGLGNPGLLYTRNRHNVGFMCISQVAKDQGIQFDRQQGNARTGMGRIGNNKVVVARPQTFMNASGESVSVLMKRLNVPPTDLIVIHDDLDLPVGKIRLRYGGSAGGHKGIGSIIAKIGSQAFFRIKVGIGRPEIPEDSPYDKESAVVHYVLSDFTREEREIMTKTIALVSEAVVCLVNEGLETAMNKYNPTKPQ